MALIEPDICDYVRLLDPSGLSLGYVILGPSLGPISRGAKA
jgi:hypothetical protein